MCVVHLIRHILKIGNYYISGIFMFIQINDSFCNHLWSNSVFLSDSAIKTTIIDAIEIKGKWGIFCCLFVFYSNIIINWSQYSETVSWFMSFFHFVKDHCSKVFFTFEQIMISFCKWYHCLFKCVLHILPEILSETECNCGSRNQLLANCVFGHISYKKRNE